VSILRTPEDLDAASFTAKVAGLVSSFGDPTRRNLYLYLREHPCVTANDLALHCGVHANVIRHHLERLMAAGYVTSDEVRRSGVGRPSKVYRVVEEDLDLDGSPRRDALLVALLERALEMLGPEAAEKMASDVGQEYGRTLAESFTPQESTRSARAAMSAVADVLTAHGFAARAEESKEGAASVVSESCPFGNAAQHHPVLCAVDRGLIVGILEGLGASTASVTLTSRARGDSACRVTA
jgi:predicted ArsR family transcriptional regulator